MPRGPGLGLAVLVCPSGPGLGQVDLVCLSDLRSPGRYMRLGRQGPGLGLSSGHPLVPTAGNLWAAVFQRSFQRLKTLGGCRWSQGCRPQPILHPGAWSWLWGQGGKEGRGAGREECSVSSSFMGGREVREASLLVPSSPALPDGEQPRCASQIHINSRPLLTSYCLNFLSHLPLLVEQQCSDSSAESGWYFLAYYAKSWAAAVPDSRLVPLSLPQEPSP